MLVRYSVSKCSRCGQSVKEIDGASLRQIRTAVGKTLGDVSRASKLSVPYLSDVELGRRRVTSRVMAAYEPLRREALR